MTEHQILAFVLVLARVSTFIGVFPLFGQRQLPALVKAGLASALTFFWYGQAAAQLEPVESINTVLAVILIAKEVGIGLFLAIALGFMLVPAKIAGAYVGQEVGLSLAAISDPGSTDQTTLMTKVLETISIFLFFALKLHHFVLLCVHHSFTTLGGKINLLDLPTEGLVQMVNDLPEAGLVILAPVGICMFLLVVALAYLNKAAPTLNLFSVGMPLRSGLGLLCLFIFLPSIVDSMTMYFAQVQHDIESLLGYFI